jgi:hypothetical protein
MCVCVCVCVHIDLPLCAFEPPKQATDLSQRVITTNEHTEKVMLAFSLLLHSLLIAFNADLVTQASISGDTQQPYAQITYTPLDHAHSALWLVNLV